MNSTLGKLGVASAMARSDLQAARDAWTQFRLAHGEQGVILAQTPSNPGHDLLLAREAARVKFKAAAEAHAEEALTKHSRGRAA